MSSEKRVAIIGGGLVGGLNACFMAMRGFHVDLYEKRPDIRTQEIVRGRSINLALSHRGREALKHVGMEEEVISNGIPMHARMIHGLDGSTHPIPYGKKDQFIMSVDRRRLNEVLLTAAEEKEVTLHFEHKLVTCDFDDGTVIFEKPGGERVEKTVDLIIGADGAFSAVRNSMMKEATRRLIRFNYQQKYISHGYMELCINPTPDKKFAMATNYLHIWPRNEYMMIGLPNQDKSFTTTLFLPFSMFEQINTEEKLMDFFRTNFPDSIPLIGESALRDTYKNNKGLPMVSVKCSPYHLGDKVVILGDAAHAMVPFYGQGMNAGFEDCLVFDEILDKCHNDFKSALPEFTDYRNVDAEAICDLAMYNYIEMRKSVNSPLFKIRKMLDNFLHTLFPNSWVPLYTMVSFTRTRYHKCIEKRKFQDRVLEKVCYGLMVVAVALSGYAVYSYMPDDDMTFAERMSDGFHRVSLWTAMKGIGYYLHLTSD